MITRHRKPRRMTLLAAWGVLASAPTASAGVAWGPWSFEHAVSGAYDGLSLRKVTYQGRALINKISFPVMRVFYENDECGPYADRLGGSLSVIPWAGNAKLAQREFTLNGQKWYEIGIRDQIGSYDIYQVYYLSDNGTIDAHIYSKGLQCVANHIHYPNWRVDFDIDGAGSDQILRDSGNGYRIIGREFDANATTAVDHAWRVRDAATGLFVDVRPGFPDFSIPASTTVPSTDYSNHTVFGRLYHSSENTGWSYGPNTQVPFNNAEIINGADIVFWYEGFLPHSALDGSELWHSTGLRLVVQGGSQLPQPPGPVGVRSFTSGSVSLADDAPASPYPSTIGVADMGGTISKVTARINGISHTYPDDLDVLLVGPTGKKVFLMSDVGGGTDATGVTLTFDSTAAASLSTDGALVSGTYRPANFGTGDVMPSPAPAGPYGTSLTDFNGLPANGDWKLYVDDDATDDSGSISAGWTLTITTQ